MITFVQNINLINGVKRIFYFGDKINNDVTNVKKLINLIFLTALTAHIRNCN